MYNLDLPETIEIRKKFMPESGTISQIAMSAMDDWGSKIQDSGVPVLIIIEGLTMYLNEYDVKCLFSVITGRFEIATVFVETMNPLIVKHFREKSIEGKQCKIYMGNKRRQNACRVIERISVC